MQWKSEWKALSLIIVIFLTCFFLPVGMPRFDMAIQEGLYLVKWYAREHVLLCLVPAFFIAGAIGVFISRDSVMKYLGAEANKVVAYGVASVSGSILAVCSCTILPLFAGIYRMGAGIGPATAFLYSGPAINVLAIVLTASVLGPEIGVARGVGAVAFSIVIGLLMSVFFKEEKKKQQVTLQMAMLPKEPERGLLQNGLYFFSMVGILVFANWSEPQGGEGVWRSLYEIKWVVTSGFGLVFGLMLISWFHIKVWQVATVAVIILAAGLIVPEHPAVAFTIGFIGLSLVLSLEKGENGEWFSSSWDFARQILPLLLIGVFVAGVLLGRVGHEGIIPSEWVEWAVGGNSLRANFLASFAGAFMYFATLTEIPILQGLIDNGMGKGPALSLLLAGPALSLPNMLVIHSVLGLKKTLVFIILVIVMATLSGLLFGTFII